MREYYVRNQICSYVPRDKKIWEEIKREITS